MGWFRRARPQTVLDLRGAAPSGSSRPPRRSLRRRARRLVLVGVIAGFVIAAALAGWLWWRHRQPAAAGKTGMQTAVARVGKLMFLPTGETPTYGTVSDATKLTNQTFFAHAQNGDQILIYEKARLTILYRPSVNKIVNVGPLIVGQQGSPYITSRIAILNGTGSTDLLDKMVTQVRSALPNATITSQGPASRSYPTSITADLTGKNQPLTEQVADILHIQGGKLPLGEPAPSADLLIIIGQDYH